MLIFLTLSFLCLFNSCSSLEKQLELVSRIEAAWKKAPLEQLEKHPYFSKLHFKDSPKTSEVIVRTYYRRGKYPSSAYCGSLGGCVGLESGDCYHVFRIKLERIDQYRQQGNCRQDNRRPSDFQP